MNTEIKIYNDINSELKSVWLDFEKKSYNHCFQSFSWLFYLISFFKKKKIYFLLQIILIKKENEIVAILPFWIINQFGLKVLQWIGNDYSDYNGPIISKDFYYRKNDFLRDFCLIKKKLAKFDIIYFERQPSNILQSENPFYFYLKNLNISKKLFDDLQENNKLNQEGLLQFSKEK